MRRVWVLMMSAVVVTGIGCGKARYEERLETTLKKLEYDRKLAKNLMEAPKADKKFTDLQIYLRPPKDEVLTKSGQLPVGEGQFDLDASFNDKVDANLHVLARVKLPKKAAAKGAPPAPPPPTRGTFDADVLGVLVTAMGAGDALATPKFSDEVKKGKRFKRLIFNAADKEVKLYIYKEGNYEVALIFAYAPALKNTVAMKIDLCLESFATGVAASRLYSGGNADEEAEVTIPGPV